MFDDFEDEEVYVGDTEMGNAIIEKFAVQVWTGEALCKENSAEFSIQFSDWVTEKYIRDTGRIAEWALRMKIEGLA